MPEVSIIIPTRNRQILLQYALKSALRQGDHCEVVVSDNDSTDDTSRIVKTFSCSRLRYCRTPSYLPITDSWEFALGKARGRYVTFLADDTVYLYDHSMKTALTSLSEAKLKMVVWNLCSYLSPQWSEPNRRNLLLVKNSTFKDCVITSRHALKHLCALDQQFPAPKLLNSLCERSIVAESIKVTGRLCLSPCPDFAAAASLLQQVREYLFIDRPLYIDGVYPTSLGAAASFNWGQSAPEQCLQEYTKPSGVDLLGFPYIPTLPVLIALSIEQVRRAYGPAFPYEIERDCLVKLSLRALMAQARNGVDIRVAWQNLQEYLTTCETPVRLRARWWHLKALGLSRAKSIRHLAIMEMLDRFRGIHLFRGEANGFSNIEECATVAPRLIKRVADSKFWSIAKRREK